MDITYSPKSAKISTAPGNQWVESIVDDIRSSEYKIPRLPSFVFSLAWKWCDPMEVHLQILCFFKPRPHPHCSTLVAPPLKREEDRFFTWCSSNMWCVQQTNTSIVHELRVTCLMSKGIRYPCRHVTWQRPLQPACNKAPKFTCYTPSIQLGSRSPVTADVHWT